MAEEDRRRYVRESCLISAIVRDGKQIHRGTVLNVSENGMFVRCPHVVQLGTAVQVRFKHPWTGEAATARGIVMRRAHRAGGGAAATGLAIALLTTLSDLEEGEDMDTSGSFPQALLPQVEQLRAAALGAAALGAAASAVTIPPPPPDPRRRRRRRGRRVDFNGVGDGESDGVLWRVGEHELSVRSSVAPDKGRLIRLEIAGLGEASGSIRVAGKVTAVVDDGGIQGFQVHILHFLGRPDEERYHALVQKVRQARSASSDRSSPQ